MTRGDPLYSDKLSFWRRDGSLPSRRIRVLIGENDSSKLLFSMLRVIVADRTDFLQVSTAPRTNHSLRDAYFPINLRNEIRAMSLLVSICEDYLSRYPTSYEADCERLDGKEVALFSNERHALIQIKGEKRVLLHYKFLAQTAIRFLSTDGYDPDEVDDFLYELTKIGESVIQVHCRYYLVSLKAGDAATSHRPIL